jgi:hypothetical protein
MTTIGILSDTHLIHCDMDFLHDINIAFSECEIIIHAGDLTDLSLLKAFHGKNVYAVHGNMCNVQTMKSLPAQRMITIEGFTIGICHGAGNRHNIEDRMLTLFPEADCIIYGHTHNPTCHKVGSILIINPGSFQHTGQYGASGTYALLHITDQQLSAKIHERPLRR